MNGLTFGNPCHKNPANLLLFDFPLARAAGRFENIGLGIAIGIGIEREYESIAIPRPIATPRGIDSHKGTLMSGSLLALLSSICFAACNICTRRGVMRIKDAALGGYISVFVAPPLFLLVAMALDDLRAIAAFSKEGYLWLGVAGIIHFVLGRSSNFWSFKYLGANMASVFSALQLVYTIFLGFFLLGEQITGNMILGSLLIMVGPALLAWPQGDSHTARGDQDDGKPRLSRPGVMAALLAGVFFGISPFFIKRGLAEGGSALAGAFISYSSASFILGLSMINTVRRTEIIRMETKALLWFVASGLFVALAQLLRYSALKSDPISVVGPLIATTPVFLLAFSFIMNRKVESFRMNVILGALLVVLGAALVYR